MEEEGGSAANVCRFQKRKIGTQADIYQRLRICARLEGSHITVSATTVDREESATGDFSQSWAQFCRTRCFQRTARSALATRKRQQAERDSRPGAAPSAY